jgi:hypothetical protein
MREFRKTTGRGKRPLVWKIGLDPKDSKTYVIQWNLLDSDAIQETRDTPGPCGVEDHSDYQTAEKYALFCIDREVRKKTEGGYIEYIDGMPVGEAIATIDFDKPLPKNLCFYKPKKEISRDNLLKLEKASRAIWTLKRDGMMHISVLSHGSWEIYSRRMDIVTPNYPHIVKALEELGLPNRTILLGEMCLLNADGTDNFRGVSQICRSKTDLSLAYQGIADFPKRKEGLAVLGKISYYVFDVAFYDGRDLLSHESVRSRLALLREIFSRIDGRLSVNTGIKASEEQLRHESKLRESMLRTKHIAPVKIYHTSADEDLELVKQLGAEGFVALDADAVYGEKGYSFDGKARRPDGSWKRKPKYEDEFIVTGTYEGTGRNRGKFGGFTIAQIHPETGERIDCGKCGGGLTDEQRETFWKQDLVGTTIKIEFDSRQPEKDGVYALRFPEYKGVSDKTPEECIAQCLEVDEGE